MSFTLFAINHLFVFIIALLSLSFSLMFWDKITLVSQVVLLLVFFAIGGASQSALVAFLAVVQILLAAFVLYRFATKLNIDANRAIGRTIHNNVR